jgi:hypothetical protein
MYILIDYTTYHAGQSTMAYENFADLKDSVIETLDSRGWCGKGMVNLKSIDSCVRYLTQDTISGSVSWKKSKSRDKFIKYRFGEKARNL